MTWSPRMTPEEIDKAWADLRWARHYIAQWNLKCLLWFAIGIMVGWMLSTSAFGQQQSGVDQLQKAIVVLQQQRNAAMDQAATYQVQAAVLAEENAKLKAEIEGLKAEKAK